MPIKYFSLKKKPLKIYGFTVFKTIDNRSMNSELQQTKGEAAWCSWLSISHESVSCELWFCQWLRLFPWARNFTLIA